VREADLLPWKPPGPGCSAMVHPAPQLPEAPARQRGRASARVLILLSPALMLSQTAAFAPSAMQRVPSGAARPAAFLPGSRLPMGVAPPRTPSSQRPAFSALHRGVLSLSSEASSAVAGVGSARGRWNAAKGGGLGGLGGLGRARAAEKALAAKLLQPATPGDSIGDASGAKLTGQTRWAQALAAPFTHLSGSGGWADGRLAAGAAWRRVNQSPLARVTGAVGRIGVAVIFGLFIAIQSVCAPSF
jgi:hypothetical protein